MRARKLGPSERLDYGGYAFYRYPESEVREKRVYYFSRKVGYLHRFLWSEAHGPIPEGHDIHHVNGDSLDNRVENLTPVPRREHRGAAERNRTIRSYVCDNCGGEFESRTGTRGENRFCSKGCANAVAYRRYRVERICPVCGGKYFTNKYRPGPYCSNRCHATTRERDSSGTFRRL